MTAKQSTVSKNQARGKAPTKAQKAVIGQNVAAELAAEIAAKHAAEAEAMQKAADEQANQTAVFDGTVGAIERSSVDRRHPTTMDFAVQQLSGPTVGPTSGPTVTTTHHPVTPPAALEAFEAARAAAFAELEAKFGIKVEAKPVKAPKPAKATVVKDQRNGITRPGAGTECAKVWNAADAISQTIHGVCPMSLLKEHPDCKTLNGHTLKTQYARWRQYCGVHGRLQTIPMVHQVPAQYDIAGKFGDLPQF